MKKLIILLILGLLLSGCSRNTEQKFTEQFPFSKSTVILYEQTLEKGDIVLYKDETGFRHAFIPKWKDSKYWISSANGELNPQDGFDWTMINDVNTPLVTFAGIITNDKITDVIVKQKTLEKKSSVVQTEKEQRIWFTYFDTLEKADPGQPAPLKIEALSSQGEILWKEGIYDGHLFRGAVNE